MFFTTYLQLIFGLDVPFLRSLFVHCSSFLYLPVRLAPSFLYLLVRLTPSFVHHSFVPLFRYYTPSPWEKSPNRRVCDWGEDIFFVFFLSARVAHTNFDIPKICHTFALLIPKNNLYYGKKSKCYFKRTLWYDW